VPRERLARGDRLRAEKFGREKERAKLDVVAFVKGKQFFISFLFPSLAIKRRAKQTTTTTTTTTPPKSGEAKEQEQEECCRRRIGRRFLREGRRRPSRRFAGKKGSRGGG